MASYFNSFFGSTAEPAAPPMEPASTDSTTDTKAAAANYWDKFSKEEQKQLGLMRRYILEQEEQKRELLPPLAQEVWKLIGTPGSEQPALFYPNGTAIAAADKAIADPEAYLTTIPSANALIKKLYNQAPAPNMMLEHAQNVANDRAHLVQQRIMASMDAARVKTSKRIGHQRPPAQQPQSPQAQAAAKKRALLQEVKSRIKAQYACAQNWEYLQNEYARRRWAIYAVRKDRLFDLLLVAEQNLKLLYGVLLELVALVEVIEQTTAMGFGNWTMVKAFGANKLAKHQLEKAFTGSDCSWAAVRSELGL